MSAALCHACQQPAESFITTADGRVWCTDAVECNHRSRLRLGVPLYLANLLRARERRSYPRAPGGRR